MRWFRGCVRRHQRYGTTTTIPTHWASGSPTHPCHSFCPVSYRLLAYPSSAQESTHNPDLLGWDSTEYLRAGTLAGRFASLAFDFPAQKKTREKISLFVGRRASVHFWCLGFSIYRYVSPLSCFPFNYRILLSFLLFLRRPRIIPSTYPTSFSLSDLAIKQ